jgi:hypothetical protein
MGSSYCLDIPFPLFHVLVMQKTDNKGVLCTCKYIWKKICKSVYNICDMAIIQEYNK